jgi:hypothetical protein
MAFTDNEGTYFWSNGSAWGTCVIVRDGARVRAELRVRGGSLELKSFRLGQRTEKRFRPPLVLKKGSAPISFPIP